MKKSQKAQQKPTKKSKKLVLKKEKQTEAAAKKESVPVHKSSFVERYKQDAIKAGLNPKKETAYGVTTITIIMAMGFFAAFYLKQPLLIIAAFLFALGVLFFLFNKPTRIIKSKRQEQREEFVHLLSFFRLFINNGKPVYVALEETRTYAQGEMIVYFDQLLSGIDEDKTIEPYLTFSNHFDSMEIKQVLISIYELSLDGGKERFLHFDSIFERIAEEKRNEAFDRLKNRLANLNFLPLVGSVFSMGLVTIAVVTLMGSSNYGF